MKDEQKIKCDKCGISIPDMPEETKPTELLCNACYEKQNKQVISVDQILAALEEDQYLGFCLACGNEQGGCEPDARKYKCEACGERKVYGAEECLIMIG